MDTYLAAKGKVGHEINKTLLTRYFMALFITLGLISRPSAKMLSLAQHPDYAQHLSVYAVSCTVFIYDKTRERPKGERCHVTYFPFCSFRVSIHNCYHRRLCRVQNMLAMYLKYHKAGLTPTTHHFNSKYASECTRDQLLNVRNTFVSACHEITLKWDPFNLLKESLTL
jgi:hypothetical protein